MTVETVIEKIKKLNALAADMANENEAALAAAKVQALLMQYNLTMETVADKPDANPYEKNEEELKCNRNTKGWKAALYHVIARHNFCRIVNFPATTKIAVIGKRHNQEAVRYMFDYLEREIERLAKKAAGYQLQKKAMYFRDYCNGAVRTINDRLKEQKEAMETTQAECFALVVKTDAELEQAKRAYFPHTTTGTRYVRQGEGFTAGREGAQGIGLRKGIGNNQQMAIA